MNNYLSNDPDRPTEGVKGLDKNKTLHYFRIERLLNKRILKTMLLITNHYPELIKFVDEMNITIPCEKHPEITHKILRTYHKSLKSLVRKYAIAHIILIKNVNQYN